VAAAGAARVTCWPDYDPPMTGGAIWYSTGNEHSPADPWGRSELAIEPGGRARLDHYFSRGRSARAWTGQVDVAALAALEAALDQASFPAVPEPGLLPPDATVRRLVVEARGAARQVSLGWHQAPSLAGYATAFDILDGVIRQLSGETVPYPSAQPQIVRDVAAQ
jgi:hypothetical protein